ncbi:MAG: hypothetical protein Q7S78_01885 [Candidatus Azambacteria bacterium]|nr:hypothetical protein [Candidatus Azambacteria bacterium]
MKRNKKRFMGMTTLIAKPTGELEKFFTTATNESAGVRALRHKMNKIRGCAPNTLIPSMEVMEIAEVPNPRHAP